MGREDPIQASGIRNLLTTKIGGFFITKQGEFNDTFELTNDCYYEN